ncbi:MAG: GNVR domain-containing protein, partial [Pseudomonadota bacterium]|nr:GNVR domain-containing protein [Pseudomonadota bacterium]
EEILQEKGTQLQGQTNKTRNEFYETIRLKIGQIESDLAGVRAGMETKQATVKRLQPIMQELPSKMQKAYQLQREQMVLEGQYKALNEKLVQATVSMTTAQSAPSAIRIVDQAYAPDKPAWPNTKLMLLVAMFFGVVLGVICALGLDLIFVRVNRYKLYNHKQYQLFAVLENDEAFVDNVYQLKK